MKRTLVHLLTLAMVLAMVIPSGAVAAPGRSLSQASTSSVAPSYAALGEPQVTTAADENLDKLDQDLQEMARAGGEQVVDVRLVVADGAITWPDYVQAVPRAQPDEATGLPVWYGRVAAKYLAKMASLDLLIHADYIEKTGPAPRFRDPDKAAPQVTEAMRARIRALRDNPPAPNPRPATSGWWDVGPGHESKKAWDKGYTGAGVTVADLDSGVDFCHPDLYGTWKVYDVSASRNVTYTVWQAYPYGPVTVPNYYTYFDGWPEMLSPFSNYAYFFDMWYNGAPTDLNTFAYGNSKFADTRATGTGDTIWFDGKVYTTTGTASIFNPVYHIGYHPDQSLEAWWWGERIGVLVVDEDGDGVYETVYVDLNDNYDFRDDQPANKANPAACWDADLDGYNDLSGGLVYFIADGLHYPPMMDWWFGPQTYGIPAPGSGELVAFMFDDPLGPAAAHGTLTAGNIVGQGRIDGSGPETRPSWKPAGVGGMIQGAGKNAKLIAIGDIYINFTASTEEGWYFASFGVDGYGDTDDGAQITSNSYGESATDNDEWDNRSRLITRLNTRTTYRTYPNTYGQRVAHLFSTGNGAPGYGTNAPPSGSTAIAIGASTQMGSTGWDSINGSDQIVWGDVIPWSNRGPTAVGHLAPSVTADGAFAAGAITSNGWGDGWGAWETWGGTSRSCPVAAGNMALIYDAWKQRTGQWPTWQEARELIMNGAADQKNDVLVQGAGAVNADKATDIAGGLYGLHVSPDAWYPGDYRGAEYPAFAQIISPGGTDSQAFSVMNHSPLTITAPLTATYLTKLSDYTFVVTLSTSNESTYDFNRPDYLWNVSQYAPSGIPAGTDLMVAEVIEPFNEFASGTTALGNNWRILWYSAKDVNGDGNLWTDTNGNGAVNTGEIDAGEYVRFSYGYGQHTYRQVSVKDPLARWKDGIYLGLQHRNRTASVPVSHLTLRVTFYKKSAWNWLSFNAPDVTVYPNSNAVFTGTVNVPADTPYGLYEGAIEVNIPAHGPHSAYSTIIPVLVNVAFSGDLTAAPITLGGTPKANTPYDNGYLTGPMDWSWRPESGDWRFYFADQTVTPTVGTRLVVRDQWGDVAPETDIDTLVLGPTSGAYTRSQPPFNFNFGDFSTADLATFGPYRLEVKAKSANRNVSNGVWAFQTATGGNVEYVVAPLSHGLHEALQHSVRWQGTKFEAPFTKTLSTLTGPTALTYTNYFTDIVSFSANITWTNGLTVEVYGMKDTQTNYPGLSIYQDPTPDTTCDFTGVGWYTYTFSLASNVAKFIAHVSVGSNDLDLFLFRDVNGNGVFDCPSERIASSTQGAGTDDEITVNFPTAGNYMVAIQGWSVSPSPSPFSWWWKRTDLDSSLAMRNANLAINPTKPATFELYNAPGACSDVLADCNDGVIYVGFPDAPRLFNIPVTVVYNGPNLSTSTKKVSASTAKPGDVLTYTISLTNTSTYTATGAMLTDTMPSGVTFGGIVAGGAIYSSTLNAVLWKGDVNPGAVQTVVYTATINSGVAHGTVIANTADVNNGLGNVRTIGPANTTVNGAILSTSSKAVDKATALPGDTLTYTLVLRNTGAIPAANAMVTDVLPAHTTFVAATGNATYSSTLNAVLWHMPSGSGSLLLPPSGAYTFTYRVQVNMPLANGTSIVNGAQVGDGYGAEWWTNQVTTTIQAANLSSSTKQAFPANVKPGDIVTFTITINNTGFAPTSNASMTDTLPTGLVLTGTPTVLGPGSVVWAGNTVTWTGALDYQYIGTQAVVRVAAEVKSTFGACGNVVNNAVINDGQGNTYTRSATVYGPCYKNYLPIILK